MNTVEIPWNLFLKSLHEESVHVATGVEFARTTNFFILYKTIQTTTCSLVQRTPNKHGRKPLDMFLKSLREESVHVARGVECARTTNFIILY